VEALRIAAGESPGRPPLANYPKPCMKDQLSSPLVLCPHAID